LTVLKDIATTFGNAYSRVPALSAAVTQYLGTTRIPASPPSDRMFLEAVLEELRVQESLEDRWRNLVRTVAPEAGDQEFVFELLKGVIKQAQKDAIGTIGTGTAPRIPYEQRLPPQYEQSLAEIVRNTHQSSP
jgi:hypothetical protein